STCPAQIQPPRKRLARSHSSTSKSVNAAPGSIVAASSGRVVRSIFPLSSGRAGFVTVISQGPPDGLQSAPYHGPCATGHKVSLVRSRKYGRRHAFEDGVQR